MQLDEVDLADVAFRGRALTLNGIKHLPAEWTPVGQ
jgi:hypothetical protein